MQGSRPNYLARMAEILARPGHLTNPPHICAIHIARPPSTSRQVPVRKRASSEARNAAASATSSGVHSRPSGMLAVMASRWASRPARRSSIIGVSDVVGLMAQTLIFEGASSSAIDLVAVTTAPFVALYHPRLGRGRAAPVDAILMNTPPWERCIAGTPTLTVPVYALDVDCH